MLDAAPDLDVAFKEEADREAARNFMDLMASAGPDRHELSMQLADFDAGMFLRDYWQKKPLLIRNPWGDRGKPRSSPTNWPAWPARTEVESRLITQDVDA